MTMPAKHISVAIRRSPAQVYGFAANPENLPKWATGLSGSIRRAGDTWVAESPLGQIRLKFAERNDLGVLDHDVTLPSGETFHNPLRVLRNQDGSEVVFTLYRQPKMSDDELARDAAQIEADLARLKSLLEE